MRNTRIIGTDLTGAKLRSANLAHASLLASWVRGGLHLETTDLTGAILTDALYDNGTHWPLGFDPKRYGAHWVGPHADLRGLNLSKLMYWHSNLRGVDLRGSNLQGAFLNDTNLRQADLRAARLQAADLVRADLRGADLTGANLTGGDLQAAHYDAHTRWPSGFDPLKHHAILLK